MRVKGGMKARAKRNRHRQLETHTPSPQIAWWRYAVLRSSSQQAVTAGGCLWRTGAFALPPAPLCFLLPLLALSLFRVVPYWRFRSSGCPTRAFALRATSSYPWSLLALSLFRTGVTLLALSHFGYFSAHWHLCALALSATSRRSHGTYSHLCALRSRPHEQVVAKHLHREDEPG